MRGRAVRGLQVIATWTEFGKGGLADYTVVDSKLAALKPPGLSHVEGAAIVNSPVNALLACDDGKLAAGDRVLVLGGSGAVGGSVIQLARLRGASFVAATSTNGDLVKRLGADVVIDYTQQNWWDVQDFKDKPFDLIVDCAEGRTAWAAARKHKVLKPGGQGGRFVAAVLQEWLIEIHSTWQMITWFMPVIARQLSSRIVPWRPRCAVSLSPAHVPGFAPAAAPPAGMHARRAGRGARDLTLRPDAARTPGRPSDGHRPDGGAAAAARDVHATSLSMLPQWHTAVQWLSHGFADGAPPVAWLEGAVVEVVGAACRYTMLMPAPRGDSLQRFLQIYATGKFQVVLDGEPHTFTKLGVCAAFNRMISRRAAGKVVVTLE